MVRVIVALAALALQPMASWASCSSLEDKMAAREWLEDCALMLTQTNSVIGQSCEVLQEITDNAARCAALESAPKCATCEEFMDHARTLAGFPITDILLDVKTAQVVPENAETLAEPELCQGGSNISPVQCRNPPACTVAQSEAAQKIAINCALSTFEENNPGRNVSYAQEDCTDVQDLLIYFDQCALQTPCAPQCADAIEDVAGDCASRITCLTREEYDTKRGVRCANDVAGTAFTLKSDSTLDASYSECTNIDTTKYSEFVTGYVTCVNPAGEFSKAKRCDSIKGTCGGDVQCPCTPSPVDTTAAFSCALEMLHRASPSLLPNASQVEFARDLTCAAQEDLLDYYKICTSKMQGCAFSCEEFIKFGEFSCVGGSPIQCGESCRSGESDRAKARALNCAGGMFNEMVGNLNDGKFYPTWNSTEGKFTSPQSVTCTFANAFLEFYDTCAAEERCAEPCTEIIRSMIAYNPCAGESEQVLSCPACAARDKAEKMESVYSCAGAKLNVRYPGAWDDAKRNFTVLPTPIEHVQEFAWSTNECYLQFGNLSCAPDCEQVLPGLSDGSQTVSCDVRFELAPEPSAGKPAPLSPVMLYSAIGGGAALLLAVAVLLHSRSKSSRREKSVSMTDLATAKAL